jgi:cytochrome b pre-mRNA-processing protein 3
MGIGDFGVPKRMKKMAQAFFGRHDAYRQALAAGDPALLTGTIDRNVFGGANGPAASALARYALESRALPVDIATGAPGFAKLDRQEAA